MKRIRRFFLLALSLLTVASFQSGLGTAVAAGAVRPNEERPLAAASSDRGISAKSKDSFRHVEIRGEWFYIDGEPFLVKGVAYSPCRPQEKPPACKADPKDVEADFKLIAEAGFNTIRTWSPLSPDNLTLANRYRLMVLQGIWMERRADYSAGAFQELMLNAVAEEVKRAKGHENVLALIVGNSLLPDAVFQTGSSELESFFVRISEVAKLHDPSRFVSHANWPLLPMLKSNAWDLVAFNIQPQEPPSVSTVFGFRSYIEHLKESVASQKPFVVTEVGLSVSPKAIGEPAYGGLSLEQQRDQVLKLWDDLYQAGAQGGVINEWSDAWWRGSDSSEDAAVHDAGDPKEWFGLLSFDAGGKHQPSTRPLYDALKTYNQAILLSPVSGESYVDRVPVTVYATDLIYYVRVRVGDKSLPATKINRHWWKVLIPVKDIASKQAVAIVMESYDKQQRLVVRQQREITLGAMVNPPQIHIELPQQNFMAGQESKPVHFTLHVTDSSGAAVGNCKVSWSVLEAESKAGIVKTGTTNARGRIEEEYAVRLPGIVVISAATDRSGASPGRRVGSEAALFVHQQPSRGHQPSPWERLLPKAIQEELRHDSPAFALSDSGKEPLVDYAKYGRFSDVGKSTYHYEIADWAGLTAAVGEGIYPNELSLLKDPAYQAAKSAGKLQGTHWDYVFFKDPQLEFFRWAEAEEEPGVKQFYTAMALEHAGLWMHAVKAYYAVLVHFPKSVGWTGFDPPTPWYVGKVARDKIEAILRLHPEIGWRLDHAQVAIEHGFDNEIENDKISVDPGVLAAVSPELVNPPSVAVRSLPKRREVGKGAVRLVQYENGHWQLLVDGKPWVIHGITYQPSAVGESPDEGTLKDWMAADRNKNGKIDAFDAFMDLNRNNEQDSDEPAVGDFELLKAMGVNTLRLYHHASSKAILRQIYQQYGIRVLMGDFVGMYTVGSGAKWEDGTNYLDPLQRKRMTESVKSMVREYKKEPYVLMWVLGNENNYGGVHGIVGGKGNAAQHPKEYYRFINELAAWIHKEDPNHPVAIANGDLGFLDVMAPLIPQVDVFGANVYRGWYGFGRSFFEEVRRHLDKPVMITEYGSPAYQSNQPEEIIERDQMVYHMGNWVDVADNVAGRGIGNALGGVAFEWCDEWWKAGQPPKFSPFIHETQPNWAGPFPGGWNFEEWYGLVSQGNGKKSPYLRQPRLSYFLYKALWNSSIEASQ